jgi:hypothetical protein
MSEDTGEFGAPYQGAREELSIWKRRALEAEAKIREQDQIIERFGDAINTENAPTLMGEPNPHHSIDWYREGIAKHWKTICDQRGQITTLVESLKFYANKDHYSTDDGLNWDSCSGEPSNILWHEEQPWFIEDGSVARACLENLKDHDK